MTLRILLVSGLALALLACADREAPSRAADAPEAPEEKVVHVYNWSDYVAPDTIAEFERDSGIRVVYDVYDSNEILEAKLMAGSSGYDVVFPSARPYAQRHIGSGLYRKLDRSLLPNHAHLQLSILSALEDIDPDNERLVPYLWGTTGLGYNVAKLRERLGDMPLDSWALLFDPAIAAKLADCGIALLDDEQEGFAAALIHLGRDPNAGGGDGIEAVRALYAAIVPHVRYFNSSKYIDDLANGEVCLVLGYSGDVLQARERAAEAANGVEIAYAVPKQGALRAIDVAAVPVDAPHVRNAHAFLDYLMRPAVIAKITNHVAYPNANADSTALLAPAIRDDPAIHPPAEVLARLVDARSLPDEESRARVRAWTAIKSGR